MMRVVVADGIMIARIADIRIVTVWFTRLMNFKVGIEGTYASGCTGFRGELRIHKNLARITSSSTLFPSFPCVSTSDQTISEK